LQIKEFKRDRNFPGHKPVLIGDNRIEDTVRLVQMFSVVKRRMFYDRKRKLADRRLARINACRAVEKLTSISYYV